MEVTGRGFKMWILQENLAYKNINNVTASSNGFGAHPFLTCPSGSLLPKGMNKGLYEIPQLLDHSLKTTGIIEWKTNGQYP